jgi:UDP-N-acetylglucosamine 1-carboxyvinyltransferase
MGLVMDHAYDQVKINGPQQLTGADLTGGDIRMTAALIMGALIAKGESRISGLDHLNRGYGNFIKKIQALHANIELSNGL